MLILWFGLTTGLIEAGVLAYQKIYQGKILQLSGDVFWMAPLANTLFLLLPGLVFLLVVWRWPGLLPLSIMGFVLALFGFLSVLLLFERLAKIAIVLLATGLAVQAYGLIARYPQPALKFFRMTLPGVILTFLALAVGIRTERYLSERRALAGLPTAPQQAPNVLLIVLDTVRAKSVSLNGYERRTTTELVQLAQSGVTFDQAITTSPWTLPSHASIFTGRFTNELSADYAVPLDDTYPTLAEFLSDNGYLTAGFVGNLIYCTSEYGLDRGFVHYEDYEISLAQVVLSSALGRTIGSSDRLRKLLNYHELLNRKNAEGISRDFLRWVSRQDGRPFFAYLNYFDPHEPYLPPPPYNSLYGPPRDREVAFFHLPHFTTRRNKPEMTPEAIQAELNAYEGAIAYTDRQIGLMIGELDRMGILENTLVIITSDHGEEMGEHRLFDHGVSLYRQELHVPLLIRFPPSVPQGARVRPQVSLRDLPVTILDLIGMENRVGFPGESLARHWSEGQPTPETRPSIIYAQLRGRTGRPDWYPSTKGVMHAVFGEGLEYILNGDGAEELYDFQNDLLEEHNLIESPAFRSELERLRATLEQQLSVEYPGERQSAR